MRPVCFAFAPAVCNALCSLIGWSAVATANAADISGDAGHSFSLMRVQGSAGPRCSYSVDAPELRPAGARSPSWASGEARSAINASILAKVQSIVSDFSRNVEAEGGCGASGRRRVLRVISAILFNDGDLLSVRFDAVTSARRGQEQRAVYGLALDLETGKAIRLSDALSERALYGVKERLRSELARDGLTRFGWFERWAGSVYLLDHLGEFTVEERGLVIHIPPGAVAEASIGAAKALVPWELVRPHLARGSKFARF